MNSNHIAWSTRVWGETDRPCQHEGVNPYKGSELWNRAHFVDPRWHNERMESVGEGDRERGGGGGGGRI